ncbi:hypothetical protein LOC68_04555 [Blastopirellula sp. JC732]|uniref:Uncharacterized protein n=1 Tax=Blastopirellula sediminis TaxID=2894196 RepID=A0A9X1MIU6_9BACT|nr:hypothetical protein [Blastopirellula sediminis]MCC9609570.1 hypothetical protein [Blastopirellula sediminis]MCC9627654.1 hypothetical protein [Blastopirellula sediminis]
MNRGHGIALAIAAAFAMAGSCDAGWHEFWERAHLDYARNKCWPEPFLTYDRMSVRNYYASMTANGIRLQNTLGDHHFDSETNQITRGGEMKIRQILEGLPDRRAVFVRRGLTPEVTQIRMASVHDAMIRMLGPNVHPEIYETGSEAYGRPADFIDDIYRAERSSIPAPRLPDAPSSGN